MTTKDATCEEFAPVLFDCARLTIRLRFYLDQAAFLLHGSHRLRSIAIARKLGRLARRLDLAPGAREVAWKIEETIAGLIEPYKAEWHYESVTALVVNVNDPEGWLDWDDDGEETRRRRCEHHLAPEIEALVAFRAALLDGLDSEGHLVFGLGELIEQGTRPGEVYRHIFRRVAGGSGAGRGAIPSGRYHLAPVTSGEVSPPRGWLGRVRATLRELGRFRGPLEFLPRRLPETIEDRHRMVARIARAIRDRLAEPNPPRSTELGAMADNGPPHQPLDPSAVARQDHRFDGADGTLAGRPGGWSAPGHLGIEVHVEGWKLRRAGRREVNFLGKPLWWTLARMFLAVGDGYADARMQLSCWEKCNLATDIEIESRTATISKLNAHLAPLGVKVVAEPRVGRRLEVRRE